LKQAHQKSSAISLGILCWDCRKVISTQHSAFSQQSAISSQPNMNRKDAKCAKEYKKRFGFFFAALAVKISGLNADC
jgi:hypothetical protein